MHIVLISPLPPPTGGISNWTKRYRESSYISLHKLDIVNNSVLLKRKEIHGKPKLAEEVLRSYKIFMTLLKLTGKSDVDIVHLNTPCGPFGIFRDYICAMIVKLMKKKLLVHCRCDVAYMLQNKWQKMAFKNMIDCADVVLTLNDSSYHYIKQQCRKESIVFPNFIADEDYNDIKRSLISDSVQTVLYVGNVIPTKGIDVILALAKRFPHLKFVLIGSMSKDYVYDMFPINVHLTGKLAYPEVVKKMLESDLFLFPSHTEGFPNVVLEAMCCGLPIIASTVGAIPNMIEDKGGILVEVNDIDGFSSALSKLVNDYDLRKQMSKWNIDKVGKEYTEHIVINKLLEVYSSTMRVK